MKLYFYMNEWLLTDQCDDFFAVHQQSLIVEQVGHLIINLLETM